MVDGRDSSGGSNGLGGFLGRLNYALENRIAMLFVASVLGAGGSITLIKANPDVRGDPFTGTQGKVLAERIERLEHSQILDDEHRKAALERWVRIRALENQCVRNEARIDNLEQRLNRTNEH